MRLKLKQLKQTLLLASILLPAQALSQQVINLYGKEAPPYSKAHTLKEYESDCWGVVCVYNVTTPTLTLFAPEMKPTGEAVLVLAGGGYETQAIYHEGYDVARKLAENGIFSAVLKYRLPKLESSIQPELVPLTDVRAAISLLREKHKSFKIDPNKIGVLGFSAGSHLATVASVHLSKNKLVNPNFSILIYGVSRLNKENKEWLENTLYHRTMTSDEVKYNTLLEHIKPSTPPAFLVHSMDDDICHYSESTLYAETLTSKGVPVEMHLFSSGGHGFGLGHKEQGTDQWINLAINWIKRNKL